jgi:hypothetical protein
LVNLKLTARGLNVMRDWRECLREYSNVFSRHFAQARKEQTVATVEATS